jgi:hypothetical protein
MYLFTYRVIPKPDSLHAKDATGGYVNCWIDFKSLSGAKKLAELAIDEDGWIIEKLDWESEVDHSCYNETDDDYQYFKEASEDGWSFVYHTYGHDAPDKDIENGDIEPGA